MGALQRYTVGIIVFSLVMLIGVNMFGSMADTNDTHFSKDSEIYRTFSDELNINESVSGMTGEFSDNVENTDGQAGGDGAFTDSLVGGSWKTLRGFGESTKFMTGVYKAIAEEFGIPTWVVVAITSIIAVLIAFAILSAIFRWSF